MQNKRESGGVVSPGGKSTRRPSPAASQTAKTGNDMKSTGTVIDIIEKKGRLLAAFDSHDGVFKFSPDDIAMRRALEEARDKRQEVVFEFHDDLTLTCVAGPHSAPDTTAPEKTTEAKP